MAEPSPADQRQFGAGVTTSDHWFLAPVNLDRHCIDALRSISAEGSTLYVHGQQLSATMRNELTSLTEWTGTSIPAGTGWPEDWYYSYRLRRPIDALEIVARHTEAEPPSIIERAWVLDENTPLWSWQRSGSELLVSGRIGSRRVTRLALALDRTPIHRDPAA